MVNNDIGERHIKAYSKGVHFSKRAVHLWCYFSEKSTINENPLALTELQLVTNFVNFHPV